MVRGGAVGEMEGVLRFFLEKFEGLRGLGFAEEVREGDRGFEARCELSLELWFG